MNRNFFIVILIFVAALVSCNKEEISTDISTKSIQLATNESNVENAVAESNYEADYFMNAEKALTHKFGRGKKCWWIPSMRYKIGHCPYVTIESAETGYPKTITLDYGDSTVFRNGRVVSGTIVIYISAEPKTDGAYREMSYIDFKVDTIAIAGSSKSMFTGDNVSTRMQEMTSSLVFTFDNGLVITRTAKKTREWIEGLETNTDQLDDKIQITGIVNATTSEGDVYVKEIVVPLIKIGDCRFIVEGIVEISENGTTALKIDYGNGECDSTATLTKDGETIEIELRRGKCK